MKCEICGLNPVSGGAIHRVNKPGEMPARWRCAKHLTNDQANEVDPDVADIVRIIATGTSAEEGEAPSQAHATIPQSPPHSEV